MKTLEEMIKNALGELQNEAGDPAAGECPSDEILGLFVEEQFTDPERGRVLEHLVLCPHCLEVVHLEIQSSAETIPEIAEVTVRAEAIRKAKDLIRTEPEKIPFDLIVRLCRDGLDVIHSSLVSLMPVAQPATGVLRGIPSEGRPEILKMAKSFDGISAEIEVVAFGEASWNVQVMLKDLEGVLSGEGIRVTLRDFDTQKELHSIPVRNAPVAFREVPSGEYVLEFMKKGNLVGMLSLSLS